MQFVNKADSSIREKLMFSCDYIRNYNHLQFSSKTVNNSDDFTISLQNTCAEADIEASFLLIFFTNDFKL
jgi:hypothetical protein